MKAFQNCTIALAQMHQDADDFVSGTYGDGGDFTHAGFKACFERALCGDEPSEKEWADAAWAAADAAWAAAWAAEAAEAAGQQRDKLIQLLAEAK